ncbi:MAG: HEAT repeat domain-containing protein [Salinibacter sp.]|uniref:HEAT repeat domain-containing protein n=1 Tax=Salinibacter sp. TaxID=2065818 RepID=UPI002FC3761C
MGGLTLFDWLPRSTPGPLLVLMSVALAFFLLAGIAALVAMGIHLFDKWLDRRQCRERAAWRPRLYEVLMQEAAPAALIDHVHPLRFDAFLAFLTPYASTIEGNEMNHLQALARPFLPVVCERAKAGPPLRRTRALRRIGLFGGSRHVPLLRTILQEDAPDLVLRAAMRELGRLGTAADVPLILETIDQLTDMDRRQISSILYELGEEAAPVLRSALVNEVGPSQERSPFVRVVCAEALRWLGDAPSGPTAATLLRTNEDLDPEVRASLLRLLRRVGRPHHAAAVRPYCESPVAFVRIHAARALGSLGAARDEAPLETRLRIDDNRWVALSAANALAELERWAPLHRLHDDSHPRASLIAGLLPSPE